VERFLFFVDRLSMWTGKTFAWCIIILTLGVSYEVFVRYVLHDPTSWAYDVSYIMYGGLFLMAGAYTVSRDGHVRADVVYRLWPPRVQAGIDLVLFILFYFPAVLAFIYSGYIFAHMSWQFGETSVYSPAQHPGVPGQGVDPGRWGSSVAAGHLRAGALRALHSERLVARALPGRRGDGVGDPPSP
jgi:TRAP-type mannitol/chloroaromatic compound transport system permease small subunit